MNSEAEQEVRGAMAELRAVVGFVSTAGKLARVSDYLLQAEIEEGDPWYAQDYRVASVMVGYAEEGRCPSYERAFLELFGKYPREVTGWWRNRAKLWFLAQDGNRPSPLLLANRAYELLLNRDLIEIPDHGWAPAGILPRLPSVPYIGEYHPSEEPQPQPEPTVRPRGVCILCSKPLCAGSSIHCHFHYRQNGKAVQRCRKRKAAQGICLNCKLPAIEGSQYCEAHRERRKVCQRESQRRMREAVERCRMRRLAQGEYPELRQPPKRLVRAGYMQAYMQGYRAGRKEQAVCLQCGQPTAGSYCIDCRRKLAQAQQRCARAKLAFGQCRHCSRPVCSPSKFYCRIHRAKQNARNRAAMQRRRAETAKMAAAA